MTNDGRPPIELQGRISNGKVDVDGSESSQFLTGMLMALPLCEGDTVIAVQDLKSKPYVRMTLDLLREFGIRVEYDNNLSRFEIAGAQRYTAHTHSVEGDWSGASFLLVAGAIAGRVRVNGLNTKSLQADRSILTALRSAGAKVSLSGRSVIVEKRRLSAFKFDATECPDLFPPLAVLACNCSGTSVISGAGRLAGKESDRALALQAELGKMGADIRVIGDKMLVKGGRMHGGKVDSRNDHRIAMACAIAALNSAEGSAISNEKCVSKSYPQFFKDLRSLQVL